MGSVFALWRSARVRLSGGQLPGAAVGFFYMAFAFRMSIYVACGRRVLLGWTGLANGRFSLSAVWIGWGVACPLHEGGLLQ